MMAFHTLKFDRSLNSEIRPWVSCVKLWRTPSGADGVAVPGVDEVRAVLLVRGLGRLEVGHRLRLLGLRGGKYAKLKNVANFSQILKGSFSVVSKPIFASKYYY